MFPLVRMFWRSSVACRDSIAANTVFSIAEGERPVWVSNKVKRRLYARMLDILRGLARERGDDPAKVSSPAWVNHDLRRTLRSRLSEWMRQLGRCRGDTGAHQAGYSRRLMIGYEHFDEKRHALDLWATQLRSIVQPQPNVIEVAKARA